jgi:hypothetical protein
MFSVTLWATHRRVLRRRLIVTHSPPFIADVQELTQIWIIGFAIDRDASRCILLSIQDLTVSEEGREVIFTTEAPG